MISAHPAKPENKRKFVPATFVVTEWDKLQPFYDRLLAEDPADAAEFEAFLGRINELESIIQEDFAWRYIHMTCDTQNPEKVEAYQFFLKNIMPNLSAYEDKLNRKIYTHPMFNSLDPVTFKTFQRSLKMDIELFREENIPLQTEEQTTSQEYGALAGKMTIEHDGNTLTLQQASKLLESDDRSVREEVWRKVMGRRKEDREKFNEIFDKLVSVRASISRNAGFSSFTDFKFSSLGRFDYDREDVCKFHDSIEKVVKPVFRELMEERRKRLGLEFLRPWDLSVGIFGETPLRPFQSAKELVNGSIAILSHLRPELGDMIGLMDSQGYLDVESRVGKAPGGYNYPLAESGIPFIFMNAAGTQSDVTTMLHESGHAVHAFLTHEIPLNVLKRMPSEVAELASMTMELFALENYEVFYPDDVERVRAMKEQLLRCIVIFPWIATVDAFQMWIYDNPDHSREARSAKWAELYVRFHGETINWSGLEGELENLWMKQGHIFDVPFYYIEYAMAQLGALAVWRNFKQNPEKGLDAYLNALKLGYTRVIPEIYEAAGIRFDFSEAYVRDIVTYCLDAYKALKPEEVSA
jgi:oligoendopeptidase F